MSSEGVFVTGATGFLGGTLVRKLLARGNDVTASGRQISKLDALAGLGARILPLDLGVSEKSNRATDPLAHDMPTCRAMVHCAALSSPWGRRADFERANIRGTQTAIELAREIGVSRFVYISTPSVYFQFADQENVSEETPLPRPVNDYAATKLEAEALVLEATDIDPVVLRPRGLYGAGDKALLPRLLLAARAGALPLMRGGAAAIDLTHIDDVVDAVMAAIEVEGLEGERVFNVSGGVMLPVKDIVEAACARQGIELRWRPLPVAMVMMYARAAEAVCRMRPSFPEPRITAYAAGLFAYRQSLNISRAETHLGWRPKIGFDEGLEMTFAGGGVL
ncbi:MAG: NAD(P)-dependent oxidoreductase [Hyphomonadaceae bacterium]